MLKFLARYARKVQYCDIACRARRRKMQFFLLLPHQSETWIDAPECMQTGFHTLKCNCWIQVNRITRYQVSREEPSINWNTLVNRPIAYANTLTPFQSET